MPKYHSDLDIEVGPSSKLFIAHINSTTDELVGNVREKAVQGSRYVTALAFRKDYPGSYLCTTNTGLAYLSEESGQLTHLPNGLGQIIAEDDKDKMRFNDAATDSKGRFYFHSMSRDEGKKAGKLYMFEKGMKGVEDLKVLETGFAIGNGPVIDEERKRFYFNFTEQGIGCESDIQSILCLSQSNPLCLLQGYTTTIRKPEQSAIEGKTSTTIHGGQRALQIL